MKFERPEIEVVLFAVENVIATSTETETTEEDATPWG